MQQSYLLVFSSVSYLAFISVGLNLGVAFSFCLYDIIIGAGLRGFVACRALSQRNNDPTKASRSWNIVSLVIHLLLSFFFSFFFFHLLFLWNQFSKLLVCDENK